MKERPILFSSEMVKAILEGRKTMTRRIVKPGRNQEWLTPAVINRVARFAESINGWWTMAVGEDRRIVHCGHDMDGGHIGSVQCPYGQPGDRLWVKEAVVTHASIAQVIGYVTDGCAKTEHWEKLRNPRFMPRWASRILLEVVSVRVERLQDISEEDAKAEGCIDWVENAADAFHELWNSLYAKEPEKQWDANPYVWVIACKRVQA